MGPGQRAAHAAAAVSTAAAASTWLSNANELAQFVASVVAIVAGLFAIAMHVRKLRRDSRDSG